jgi:hypothetical protein
VNVVKVKAWRRRAAAAFIGSYSNLPTAADVCPIPVTRKTTQMLETPLPSPSVFTATSAYSLAGVAGIAVIATTAAGTLLPKNAPWQDRVTFIWLVRTTTHGSLSHPNHFFSGLLLTTTVIPFPLRCTIYGNATTYYLSKSKTENLKLRRLTPSSTLSSRAPSSPCRPSGVP